MEARTTHMNLRLMRVVEGNFPLLFPFPGKGKSRGGEGGEFDVYFLENPANTRINFILYYIIVRKLHDVCYSVGCF